MNRAMIASVISVGAVAIAAGVGVLGYRAWWHANYYEVEYTDYNPPQESEELQFTDDTLEDKNPTFDESLVDSRPLGEWEVNASAAVIRLDCPMLKPDRDANLLALRPSYAAAIEAAKKQGWNLLPSANLIDGAAKQFDDGLYAALDLAAYRGELGLGPPAPELARTLFDALRSDSPARPFLAAALDLAGKPVKLTGEETAAVKSLLGAFEAQQTLSKPIAFYTWTPELKRVWRFYRFLQHEFNQGDLEVPRAIAAVLEKRPELQTPYVSINGFYSQLTNPLSCLSVDLLIGNNEPLEILAKKHGRGATVALFPPSTSRETELFNRVFALGLPPGANLMARLIRAIRSGEVDLKPGGKDGWYQYQVYALETMLLPSQGQEGEKLQLTAAYKKRLVEAFKALITKRRETHSRQAKSADGSAAPRPEVVQPRLRIEPCATYYLRTARAYAFLQNFLLATVGKEPLAKLHGLRKEGPREPNLAEELDAIRRRSYGFYLISCEDLGMRPKLLDDEPVDQPAAKQAALDWLERLADDADLACDTRVSVPIFANPMQNTTRLWATLGVRLARLEATYARPPKIRPTEEGGPWQEVKPYELGESRYVIPVDEFAEIELDGSRSLTRQELRQQCDRHQSKEAILKALVEGGGS